MPRSSILTAEAKKEALKACRAVIKSARYDRNMSGRCLRGATTEHKRAVLRLEAAINKYNDTKGQEIMAYKPTGKPRGRPRLTDEQKAANAALRAQNKATKAALQAAVPADLTPLIPSKPAE